ncbi:sigma-54 dependent transcriptional regulator [Arcicella rosea]|uniref:DNA-binding NtrC family response regulator n=1 Tax=Arcicella rosea TaxID=502909 RepID=A0A841ELG2_9BACT|nr:sigma-54 dependent transcriptional regulator [Arcicella rosea]MBB6002259.1 DNA-binding NtrC family response regulator [Arcicella rosea]
MSLKNAKILAIDDDPDVLVAVKMLLRPEVREIVTEKNPERIQSLLAQTQFDLILLDMNYKSSLNTGNEGIFWLRKIREINKSVAVIMITAYGDIDLAVRSVKEGATDFVLKPWRNEKLLVSIEEALEKSALENPISNKNKKSPAPTIINSLLGKSEAMQDIFYKIEKIAPTDANILILGENGTGKGEVAKLIHQKSMRAGKPFVHADLGSLTESLFESELFGHKKGAFTDAREDRAGRFESANKGTLFLDEIGNISLPQQAKLLTVLQNREVTRLGTNAPIAIDIRLISATNAPIKEMSAQNQYRKDLIYRLNTIEITLPPLRSRGDDVVLLAEYFTKTYAQQYHKNLGEIDEKAKDKLRKYAFPGNIRELQHAIERAVIMSDEQVLTARDLDLSSSIENPIAISNEPNTLRIDEMEKSTILKAIERHEGNITKAARELGLTRTALYRRLGKYDI